ncbi:Deoxyribose-phosphate aldolase [Actinomycetales bacterium JB111]|jgi:deoxyribose-phosphate aldolase|nr:Deoxyribose-phosphate aldolase [Actinomycetales bacterium JB111]
MNASLTRDELAQYVDHTLLKPESTPEDVQRLIAEGAELGAFSVCISPNLVPVEVPEGLKLAVVCGFPSGAHAAEVKAAEAAHSAAAGVDEIDMVINLALARTGRFDEVEAEIRAVREAAPNVLLKVIIESAALTDEQIVAACEASERAGADYVKTSTGFHSTGGATEHAVALMAKTVGGRLGVKASGGIRDTETALKMIAAGATRLGLSGTKAVLDGLDA